MTPRASVAFSAAIDRAGAQTMRAKAAPPRLSLSPAEAAATLGVSRDFFDEHVLPELRVTRRGRLILVSVRELEAWLERSGARTLDVDLVAR
jgi:excisionase family DNA binding protein